MKSAILEMTLRICFSDVSGKLFKYKFHKRQKSKAVNGPVCVST